MVFLLTQFPSCRFYPYHYAPFASDMRDLKELNISFELGTPFKPFDQLLGVLPAASAHALPREYRKLMTDLNSPIIDFYPTDFEVDMNGKRFDWQGIAKLSFIDETRLLAEVAKLEHTLTDEEVRRNSTRPDMLFVASSHPLSPFISSLDYHYKQLTVEEQADKERNQFRVQLDPGISGGMNGYISLCDGVPCPSIFKSPVEGMEDIMNNQVICAIYRLPDMHKHITHPPVGVKLPQKTVTVGDLKRDPVLWHEDSGNRSQKNDRKLLVMEPSLLQFPKGAISGQQLVDAARRLLLNSLHLTTDKSGCGDQNTKLKPVLPSNSLTNIVVTASPRAINSPRTARKQLKRKQQKYKKQQMRKGKETCGLLK